MSKAIKCDRCGLFFVPDSTSGEYIHIDDVLYKNVRFGADKSNTCVRQETFGDICHKCTLDFKKFCSGIEVVDKKLFDDLRKDYDALLEEKEKLENAQKNNGFSYSDTPLADVFERLMFRKPPTESDKSDK